MQRQDFLVISFWITILCTFFYYVKLRLLVHLFPSQYIFCTLQFTAQSWGVLVYENLHVLNVLTKGTLSDTLANREWRLVLALMVRESYKV